MRGLLYSADHHIVVIAVMNAACDVGGSRTRSHAFFASSHHAGHISGLISAIYRDIRSRSTTSHLLDQNSNFWIFEFQKLLTVIITFILTVIGEFCEFCALMHPAGPISELTSTIYRAAWSRSAALAKIRIFEFLNFWISKTVNGHNNGHINGRILRSMFQLVGHQ